MSFFENKKKESPNKIITVKVELYEIQKIKRKKKKRKKK